MIIVLIKHLQKAGQFYGLVASGGHMELNLWEIKAWGPSLSNRLVSEMTVPLAYPFKLKMELLSG